MKTLVLRNFQCSIPVGHSPNIYFIPVHLYLHATRVSGWKRLDAAIRRAVVDNKQSVSFGSQAGPGARFHGMAQAHATVKAWDKYGEIFHWPMTARVRSGRLRVLKTPTSSGVPRG